MRGPVCLVAPQLHKGIHEKSWKKGRIRHEGRVSLRMRVFPWALSSHIQSRRVQGRQRSNKSSTVRSACRPLGYRDFFSWSSHREGLVSGSNCACRATDEPRRHDCKRSCNVKSLPKQTDRARVKHRFEHTPQSVAVWNS